MCITVSLCLLQYLCVSRNISIYFFFISLLSFYDKNNLDQAFCMISALGGVVGLYPHSFSLFGDDVEP
jgi:hypothetical protein